MANHVTNIIRSETHVIHDLLSEAGVDFSRLIPPPEDPDLHWFVRNWGTKRNAYVDTVFEKDTVVTFLTAWAHPYPVLDKLSEKHPDDLIEVAYADEDLGHNFGVYMMLEGHRIEIEIPEEGTDEGKDLASLLTWGVRYTDLMTTKPDDFPKYDVPQVLEHALHGGRWGNGPLK